MIEKLILMGLGFIGPISFYILNRRAEKEQQDRDRVLNDNDILLARKLNSLEKRIDDGSN